MTYTPRTDWVDEPSHATPVMAADLLRIENGVAAVETEALAAAATAQSAATTAAATDATSKANAAQTAAVQRANHTGTQTMSTISNAGTAATRNVGTTTGTVAAGDDSRFTSGTVTPATAIGTNGIGYTRRGVHIPAGSLDVWRAARDNAANELVEVAIFGDSTSAGACYDPPAGSNNLYTWIFRLRARIASAGFPNGGRGVTAANEIAAGSNPDGIPAITAQTGFAGSDNFGALLTDTLKSTAGGDSVTVQGKGTAIRLHYTTQTLAGGFTYSIDGGAAVTVEATAPGLFTNDSVLCASGLTEGTHTVTVVNLGGSVIVPPTVLTPTTGGFGSGANTNMADSPQAYDYLITYVNGSGESLASNVVTKAQPSTGVNRTSIIPSWFNNGAQSYNLYRRNSGSGVYGLLANVTPTGGAGNTGSVSSYTDTGAVAPNTGINPPVTNTAGRNSANSVVQIVPCFLRATGIVINKNAVSGISSSSYFGTANPSNGNGPAQSLLGVIPGVPSSGQQFSWVQPEGAHPKYTRCRLAVFVLGINDMQGAGSVAAATAAAALLRDDLAIFVRMARSAGADPLVVIPHYNIAVGNHTYAGEFIAASASTAQSMSVPYVDFNEALGPAGTWPAQGIVQSVHTNQLAYNLEADFLWDKALSL